MKSQLKTDQPVILQGFASNNTVVLPTKRFFQAGIFNSDYEPIKLQYLEGFLALANQKPPLKIAPPGEKRFVGYFLKKRPTISGAALRASYSSNQELLTCE